MSVAPGSHLKLLPFLKAIAPWRKRRLQMQKPVVTENQSTLLSLQLNCKVATLQERYMALSQLLLLEFLYLPSDDHDGP